MKRKLEHKVDKAKWTKPKGDTFPQTVVEETD